MTASARRNRAPTSRMTAGARWIHDQGLDLTAVASQAGVSPVMVSHWLRGYRRPSESLYRAIAVLVGNDESEQLRAIVDHKRFVRAGDQPVTAGT